VSPVSGRGGRNFALWTTVKVIVAAIVVFILARILIPNLVNAHDTALLIVAVALGFVTVGVIAWTILSIRNSYRRLHRTGTSLMKVEE
jgi:hypothetical protein